MIGQATEAVMRAFGDGLLRQSVRLRVDADESESDAVDSNGMSARWNASIDIAKDFAAGLMPESPMRELKTTVVKDASFTLIYRIAGDPSYDSGVLHMVERDFMVSDEGKSFFGSMGHRLVVLSNTEDAGRPWGVDNWNVVADPKKTAGLREMFTEQTYFYQRTVLNKRSILVFRAYPHPWEIWVEKLDSEYLKVWEIQGKLRPSCDDIITIMKGWEEHSGVDTSELAMVTQDTQAMMADEEDDANDDDFDELL